jgi:hypothetical protein
MDRDPVYTYVQGGQGRSARSTCESASALAFCLLLAGVLLAILAAC